MTERITYVILGLGVLVTLGFMLRVGETGDLFWWIVALPFAAWGIFPYGAAAYGAYRMRSARRARTVMLLAALVLVGFALAVLYSAFVTSLDAQSGLIFLFLPVWQLIVLLPFMGGALWLRSRDPRADP